MFDFLSYVNNVVSDGKEMGVILEKLKESWVASDFESTTEDLLKLLPSEGK